MLTDIGMPGTSGLDLLRTLKTVAPGLPVLELLSGLFELGLALSALQNGAADYLVKPVNAKELSSVVKNHLRPDRNVGRSALKRFSRIAPGEERPPYSKC